MFGEDSHTTTEARLALAISWIKTGDLAQGRALLERVIAQQQAAPDPDHARIAQIQGWLAALPPDPPVN